jgi:hypothetical protein
VITEAAGWGKDIRDGLFSAKVIPPHARFSATIEEVVTMRRIAVATRLFSLIALTIGGCGPPQIGADKNSFKTVDALYTAVSLRDHKLLDQCEKTLRDLEAKGKLPEAAGKSLEAIVSEARAEKWEIAQSRLGDFMRGQRR